MISAANDFDAVQKELERISTLISEAAKKGIYEIEVQYDNAEYSGTTPSASAMVDKIIARIAAHGYDAKWSFIGSTYVPRGQQDDQGDGPIWCALCIRISWRK